MSRRTDRRDGNQSAGGGKPRPYGFGGISASSVGAGFTPARYFWKNDHDPAVPSKDGNQSAGGGKPRPYGFGGISASSVGAGFTPARYFWKNDHAPGGRTEG